MTDIASPRFRDLPRPFWLVWTGTLVNRVGTFVQPFLVLYLTNERGLSASQSGVVLGAYGAGAFVSQIIGGWFTDRFGRRATLVGGLLGAAGALLLLGASRGFLALVVAAALVGVLGDIYRPATTALIADVVDPQIRPYAFGLVYWAINLGFAIAAVLAGFLAEQGYGLLFVVDAITCAAFALVIALGIRRDPERPPIEDDASPSSYATALRDRLMVGIAALTFVQANLYMQAYITVPLAVDDAGLGPSDYGVVIALNGVLIVALQPWATRRLQRHDRVWVAVAAQTLLSIGFGLTALADTVPAFMLTVVVWTLGEIAYAGFLFAVVAEIAPPDARGRYLGVFGTAFGAAALTAPLLGTSVYAVSPGLHWTLCLVIGLVSGLGWLVMSADLHRRAPASIEPVRAPGTRTTQGLSES